jgi:hypothetical protein
MRSADTRALLSCAAILAFASPEVAHASDDPLAAQLAHIRSDPAAANDAAAIDRLATLAQTAPATELRAEALMVAAEAWLGRFHRENDARYVLRRVADDPSADHLTRELAEREIIDASLARGDVRGAAREVREHGSWVDARFGRQVLRLERRDEIRVTAVAGLASFASFSVGGLFRAWRRGALRPVIEALRSSLPMVASLTIFVAGCGGWLASRFERGNAGPFVALGCAVVPVSIAGVAWGAVGSPSRAARTGRALACALSVFSVAFLVLYACSPNYLDGFGL